MISVITPIDRAFAWTKQVLFRPFAIQKWLTLGFCAFLASLVQGGSGGGGGGSRFQGRPFHGYSLRDSAAYDHVSGWVLSHMHLVLGLGLVLLIVIVGIVALCQWLGSRGQFMFLDGVVHDRAAVVEPWHRFRELGNDLFVFRFLLLVVSLGYFAVVGYLGWRIARPDIAACHFGKSALTAVTLTGGLTLLGVLAVLLVHLLLTDFMVPVMYHRNIRTGHALGVLWREIIPGHAGSFALFFLMEILLGIAALVIIFLGACCTCCIAALPYVSSVVFLPIFVFFRSYSLYFLEQFGEEWRVIGNPGMTEGGD